MVVPAKNIIANTINEETKKPQITLCDGTEPDIIEDDVEIKITGIQPVQVDGIEEVVQSGNIPKIGGITTVTYTPKVDVDTTVQAAPKEPDVIACDIPVLMFGGEAWPAIEVLKDFAQPSGDVIPLKFNLSSDTGVVILEFDSYSLADRFQVFWPGPPAYDESPSSATYGKPTNLVIDTGFWGSEGAKQQMINALKAKSPAWDDNDLKAMSWNSAANPVKLQDPTQPFNIVTNTYIADGPKVRVAAFDKDKTDKDAYAKVWAPQGGTQWEMKLLCPVKGTKMSDDDYKTYNTGAGMKYPMKADGKPYYP
jgi:hypothetical protein